MLSGPPASFAAAISRSQIAVERTPSLSPRMRAIVLVRDDARQAVGAEQVALARARRQLDDVDLGIARRPTARASRRCATDAAAPRVGVIVPARTCSSTHE